MYLLYVIVSILQIPIERLGSLIVLHYKPISPVPIEWHCLLYDTIIIMKRLLKLQKNLIFVEIDLVKLSDFLKH